MDSEKMENKQIREQVAKCDRAMFKVRTLLSTGSFETTGTDGSIQRVLQEMKKVRSAVNTPEDHECAVAGVVVSSQFVVHTLQFAAIILKSVDITDEFLRCVIPVLRTGGSLRVGILLQLVNHGGLIFTLQSLKYYTPSLSIRTQAIEVVNDILEFVASRESRDLNATTNIKERCISRSDALQQLLLHGGGYTLPRLIALFNSNSSSVNSVPIMASFITGPAGGLQLMSLVRTINALRFLIIGTPPIMTSKIASSDNWSCINALLKLLNPSTGMGLGGLSTSGQDSAVALLLIFVSTNMEIAEHVVTNEQWSFCASYIANNMDFSNAALSPSCIDSAIRHLSRLEGHDTPCVSRLMEIKELQSSESDAEDPGRLESLSLHILQQATERPRSRVAGSERSHSRSGSPVSTYQVSRRSDGNQSGTSNKKLSPGVLPTHVSEKGLNKTRQRLEDVSSTILQHARTPNKAKASHIPTLGERLLVSPLGQPLNADDYRKRGEIVPQYKPTSIGMDGKPLPKPKVKPKITPKKSNNKVAIAPPSAQSDNPLKHYYKPQSTHMAEYLFDSESSSGQSDLSFAKKLEIFRNSLQEES